MVMFPNVIIWNKSYWVKKSLGMSGSKTAEVCMKVGIEINCGQIKTWNCT